MQTKKKKIRCNYEKDLKRLQSLRPIDDDFMRCIFKDNIPLAQKVLRIILDKPFADGEHILYVNGAYREDDAIGKLMHDFSCADPDEMIDKDMAEVTRYYKESEKGVSSMCKIFDEVREESREEGREEGKLKMSMDIALELIALGEDSYEKIAKVTKLSVEEVKQLAESVPA